MGEHKFGTTDPFVAPDSVQVVISLIDPTKIVIFELKPVDHMVVFTTRLS